MATSITDDMDSVTESIKVDDEPPSWGPLRLTSPFGAKVDDNNE
jgi:hypothetical protein